MQTFFYYLSQFLRVYSTVIIIYIILSWFQRDAVFQKIRQMIAVFVEPYVSLFRFPFLIIGPLDLAPLVAIATLNLLQQVVTRLAMGGSLSFTSLLFSILWGAIDLFSGVAFFLSALLFFRAVTLFFFQKNNERSILDNLDNPLYSLVAKTIKPFIKKPTGYKQGLLISAFVWVVIAFFVRVGIPQLILFLSNYLSN